MSNYWNDRNLLERERLLDKTIFKIEKQMKINYNRTRKKICTEMENLYNKILLEAGTDKELVSHLYQFNRYYDLLTNMNSELKVLNKLQNKLFQKRFETLYKQNSKLISDQFGLSSAVNPDMVKRAVNSVWCADGKNWSDRLWVNKVQLLEKLSQTMVDAVAAGFSTDKLTKQVMNEFGSSYNSANRLVRTELSHIYNQSALDKYEEAGIKKVIYLTGRDERTCEQCSEFDGKEYLIDDPERPNIPLHPFAAALGLLNCVVSRSSAKLILNWIG